MTGLEPLLSVLSAAWNTFFLAAPYVLFGLLIAGLLQVLVSQRQLARWMGGSGLAAAARAALLGIPLPICSCGIVPVAISLRRKGASRPALLSFLITTPESSADAVVLTWGLMGPLMALARLVTAVTSAIVAAVLAIATGALEAPEVAPAPRSGETPGGAARHAGHDRDTGREPHPEEEPGSHPHPHLHSDAGAEDDAYVGFRALGAAAGAAVRRIVSPPPEPPPAPAPAAEGPEGATATPAAGGAGPAAAGTEGAAAAAGGAAAALVRPAEPVALAGIFRAVGRRAFVELVDDIVFWLVVGVLVAGIIAALVPAGLIAAAAGGGLLSILLLLLLAIPTYVCASSSTPIAAALVAKGVSPGAALVFLLAGPATNAATITLLARHFGGRFLRLYLGAVLVVAVLCGLALDWLVAATGWRITGQLASQSAGVSAFFELVCALALLALIVWRLWAGAARQGLRELADNLRGMRQWLRGNEEEGASAGPERRAEPRH